MKTKPLTEVEWDTCWMAIRYAMGRQTIATAMLPADLLRAYYNRWSEGQKKMIVRDLKDHIKNHEYFGNKNIDYPVWMKFMLTLDESKHVQVKTMDNNYHTMFEYNGEYYPIDWFKSSNKF